MQILFLCCTASTTGLKTFALNCVVYDVWNVCRGVAGFFDESGSAAVKEFHKVANALSYEYRFAHSYSRSVHERYGYRKYVLFLPLFQ